MTRAGNAFNVLASGLFLAAAALCIAASYHFIDFNSVATLLVFDFLFLTLTFYLRGTSVQKLGLLALGNLVGFACNVVFYAFQVVGIAYFGGEFNVVYLIAYPMLNLLWVVLVWSISLAALPKPKDTREPEVSK